MILDTLLNFDALNIYGFEGFFTDINPSDRTLFVTISSPERLGSLHLDESILEVLSNPEQFNRPFLKLLSDNLKKLSSLKFQIFNSFPAMNSNFSVAQMCIKISAVHASRYVPPWLFQLSNQLYQFPLYFLVKRGGNFPQDIHQRLP